jgi:hypothetical protein
MKNKKYEGSVDAESKMPFMEKQISDNAHIQAGNNADKKDIDTTIELDDRIIEINDK